MCGICGIVSESVTDDVVDSVRRMTAVLHHRGPDASNIQTMHQCTLGHTRLSIIDISGGYQPMTSEDGDICISFNGEIYGYQDIRRDLEMRGVSFLTNSDTEVIIQLYKIYGISMLEHLPGAFSFAIWDKRRKRLFCARDRAGEKPLYYASTKHGLVFASEMKAIISSSFVTPEIKNSSLIHYLGRGYVQPNASIFSNVQSLPPASYMVYQDGKLKIEKYWSIPDEKLDITLSEAVDGFSEKLTSSVQRQMISDVDVNFFLSGGLDSSTLVSIGSGLEKNIRTISFGYEGEASELPYAREVAQLYSADSIEVLEKNMSPFQSMKNLAKVYDEPFWDSSAIATFEICSIARKYGKVVITGDGADELLGGYGWWYDSLALLEEFSGLPRNKRISQMLGDFSKLALRKMTLGLLNFSGLYQRNGDFYKNHLCGRSAKEIRERGKWLLSKAQFSQMGFDSESIRSAMPVFSEFNGTVNDSLRGEFSDYLSGNMLTKVDRAAMANSLEARMPFLDIDLVSFVSRLPSKYKITSKSDKILLREAFDHKWPDSIKRRKKQGFGVNSSRWSSLPDYSEYMSEYVHNRNSKMYSFIDYDGIKKFIASNRGVEYSVLMLAMWAENYAS